jgi:hypothetical protein
MGRAMAVDHPVAGCILTASLFLRYGINRTGWFRKPNIHTGLVSNGSGAFTRIGPIPIHE